MMQVDRDEGTNVRPPNLQELGKRSAPKIRYRFA
jgi:hypothetical protein